MQWLVIDSKVYDVTKFRDLHPGGAYVLTEKKIAGQDATDAFFSLHRQELLRRPQYSRLQIGTIKGETASIQYAPEELSQVPYAEPTWLVPGYSSPYYTENHRQFQKAMRKFFIEVVAPDAQACEDNGKRLSQTVVDKLACVIQSVCQRLFIILLFSELNIIAMRFGPGKHLKGLTLMGGIVKPEEFDYFHEV